MKNRIILFLLLTALTSCATATIVKFYDGPDLPKEQICILCVKSPSPLFRSLYVRSIDGKEISEWFFADKILLHPGEHSVTASVWYAGYRGGSESPQTIPFSCKAGCEYVLHYKTYGWATEWGGCQKGYWNLYIEEKH